MSGINPFQPPRSIGSAAGGQPQLRKLPVLVMIGLEIIKFGFYAP